MTNPENQQQESEGLGFDPFAIVLGLRLKIRWLIPVMVLAAIVAVACSLSFGQKIFQSETILRYRKVGQDAAMGETNFILTQINMIKLAANLEQVREELALKATLSSIGQAISASLQRNTSLVSIKATWNDPQTAASITNCITEVFLQSSLKTRRAEAMKKMSGIESGLEKVRAELQKAETALQEFTTSNKVIDLNKEAQWYLEQLINIDTMFEQARIEEKTVNLQLENLSKLIENLKQRVAEETANNATLENIGALNIKIGRLKEQIFEDKAHRAALLELKQKEEDLARVTELFNRRLIASAEVDKARTEYEKQKAMTIETEKTLAWKKEADELKKKVIPVKGEEGPSGEVLKAMMLKSFDLDLTAVAIRDKVAHLEKTKNRIKDKLDQLPVLQREFVILSREVSAWESEKKSLEAELAVIKSQYESKEFDFTVISPAKVPLYPYKSNRKIIAIGTFSVITLFFLTMLLLFELIDTSIRSEKDLQLKLGLKVIGVLPRIEEKDQPIFPLEKESSLIEHFRIIAKQIRSLKPENGLKILFVSAGADEGKTLAATNLASCYGRTDERVLLLDAQVRDIKSRISVKDFLADSAKKPDLVGLGEYLSFKADSAEEILYPSFMPRVTCIPRVGEAVIPDLINSNRMKELFKDLSEKFSIIMIDSPSIIDYVDADVLCSMVDAVVFVVRSRKYSNGHLKKALKRIEQTGTPILGAILTDVNKIYL